MIESPGIKNKSVRLLIEHDEIKTTRLLRSSDFRLKVEVLNDVFIISFRFLLTFRSARSSSSDYVHT